MPKDLRQGGMIASAANAAAESGACPEAVSWLVNKPDLKTAWHACHRGDWLAWCFGLLAIDQFALASWFHREVYRMLEKCSGDEQPARTVCFLVRELIHGNRFVFPINDADGRTYYELKHAAKELKIEIQGVPTRPLAFLHDAAWNLADVALSCWDQRGTLAQHGLVSDGLCNLAALEASIQTGVLFENQNPSRRFEYRTHVVSFLSVCADRFRTRFKWHTVRESLFEFVNKYEA